MSDPLNDLMARTMELVRAAEKHEDLAKIAGAAERAVNVLQGNIIRELAPPRVTIIPPGDGPGYAASPEIETL
jgi:hypothetical protein